MDKQKRADWKRCRAAATLAVTLLSAACSGGEPGLEESRAVSAAGDTSGLAADHSGHVVADSAEEQSGGVAPMAGMDHSASGTDATAGAARPPAGIDHAIHAAASVSADTEEHTAGEHGIAGAASGPPVGGIPVVGHEGMPGMRTPSPAPARSPAAAAEHAAHVPASPQPAGATPAAPAGSDASAVTLGRAEAAASDSTTAKLLVLGRELVRDTVVQQLIQQDPALRATWEDPEVRELITSVPPR